VPYHRRAYGLIPHIVIRFREAECTTAAASFQQFFGFLNLVQVLRNYGDDSKRRSGLLCGRVLALTRPSGTLSLRERED
jgi:hypothetical protein